MAPDATAYAMISSSQIVDPELTLEQLPGLGSRLELPEGWSFRARTLAADLVAVAGGEAVVLQDELQNTYQRVGAVTECSDGLDNDEDGLFDWDGAGLGDADPDCSGPDDYYEETGCGLGFELVFLLPLLIAARGRARGVVVSGERSGA